ncbi:hypothetical protein AURDEDRAFT_117066 [Auricularia subglabra TFB-10046 SS5]|uniref:F-box domain-containing protein n=1 Tax=Auricularia subglabra (strain TFB-10046 / SS5) TaxID=717982 RepID=J0CYW8_AURST|nr:hypothetical protein AURDEDRAFT_117066 [Auricularia subglabra TFB-10046 SS5]
MDTRHRDRFVDYVRRVGLHELSNWSDPMMCPEDIMGVLRTEIVDIVFSGLARAGREWNAKQRVNRLPLELIGLVCSDLTLKERGRASHICTNWRSAVVSNATLWNVIDEPHATGHGLPTFLERSASAPVSLTCWDFETDAMAYWVENHLPHIQRLTMGLTTKRADIILRSPAPILEVFTLRCPGYTLHSSIFGGQPTRLTDVTLILVRLPESTPVSAFLTTRSLNFKPSSVHEIDLLHIFRVFPALGTLTLDASSCPVGGGHPVVPSAGDIHDVTHVILKGPAVYVAELVQYFRGRVRRITVNAPVNVLSLVITPPSGGLPARRLTWLHRDHDSALDSITVYQSSEPWADPSPAWRCFQRVQDDVSMNLSWFVMSPAYTETLTSLVIHDTFWPTGPATLPRMAALQLLTVLCAAKRLRPDLYFAKEGSATLECPGLQALCLGALERGWGGREWKKVPSRHASFFIRDILGFGKPSQGGEIRKVKELAFKNLTLIEEGREKVDELADRIWFDDDPGWDGLWF